jgi:ferredoxin
VLPDRRGRLLGRSQGTSGASGTTKQGFLPAHGHGPGNSPRVHSRFVKIVLDADRCTGHGRCYSLAPELFDSDDDGHSVVIASEVPAGLEAQARLAVDNCPETCISLEG